MQSIRPARACVHTSIDFANRCFGEGRCVHQAERHSWFDNKEVVFATYAAIEIDFDDDFTCVSSKSNLVST